jgi:hypothetical protein
MEVSGEVLAWRKGEGSGVLYTASDLRGPEKVKELFAACKEAEGYITGEGWAFLFSIWSLHTLLDLDLDVGWFHSGKAEEHAAHLVYQSLMAGYNPISREKGDYDADSGLFLSFEGRKEKIDWDEMMRKGI